MTILPIRKPAFFIRDIPVYGDLILAPMDGITCHPFRALTRTFGSAVSYTEFIGANDAIYGRPHLDEHIYFSEQERPLIYQILDNDPERLLKAALRLQERRPDAIDINLGCCARDVSNRGAGAGLLRSPEVITRIFKSLTQQLSVPVTAKIRLGWDDESRNYLEVAKILEDNGVALIAVHGRTRSQGYQGRADWQAIAQVKASVSIPVIANGDVRTVADIQSIKEQTGCDAVMIGRASVGNPWIFSRINRDQVLPEQVRAVIIDHLTRMVNFNGSQTGLMRFRRHLVSYLKPYPIPADIHEKLVTCPDPQPFVRLLDQVFEEYIYPTM